MSCYYTAPVPFRGFYPGIPKHEVGPLSLLGLGFFDMGGSGAYKLSGALLKDLVKVHQAMLEARYLLDYESREVSKGLKHLKYVHASGKRLNVIVVENTGGTALGAGSLTIYEG